MKGLLILLAASFVLSTPVKAQLPIGVVDMERCLKEYKKGEEQKKQMKQEIDDRIRAISEEKRKIEAMKDSMDLYTKGSQEWLDVYKKIKIQEGQVEFDQQALQFQYSQKLAEMITKLYEDIRREIKSVAEEKKLKLVLVQVSTPIKSSTETDVTNNILVRPVVYFDPACDITAEVVSRLNK